MPDAELQQALQALNVAFKAVLDCVHRIDSTPAPAPEPDTVAQAIDAARRAELDAYVIPHWVHIVAVAGGFAVTTSPNAVATPYGPMVPQDAPCFMAAAANLEEVAGLMHRRFSE